MSTVQPKRLLLLDGDILAFQCLIKCQFECHLVSHNNSHFIHRMVNFDEACYTTVQCIENISKDLKADKVLFCYTDSSTGNFRKQVYPAYKSNRVKLSMDKPLGLGDLINYLSLQYHSAQVTLLEADDVMGLKATDPDYEPDYQKIIVSEDKDMQTVPGWLYNPRKDTEPRLITEAEANRYLATQCIAGDTCDGYPGCPGIGMKTAATLVDNKTVFVRKFHTLKSGPRRGVMEIRWTRKDGIAPDLWTTVLSCYEKTGLTEDEAIANARCARILRHGDYRDGKVIPWEPWDNF